jgi:hypothetical protein
MAHYSTHVAQFFHPREAPRPTSSPPPPPHCACVCLQGKVVVFEKMKNERKEMTSSHGEGARRCEHVDINDDDGNCK